MSLAQFDPHFRAVRAAKSLPEACHALAPLFVSYEVISVGLTRGTLFWRARVADASPFATAHEMGPPPPKMTAIGRLNDANWPVLYASLKEDTALAEIRVQAGTHAQLAGYRVLLGEEIRLALVGELMHVYNLGYAKFIGGDPGSTFSKMLNGMEERKARACLYIDAFLHQLLSDPLARTSNYTHSRAVAAMLLMDSGIDGIAYPSAMDPLGYNITLKPEAVEHKIHLMTCFHCQVERIHEFGFCDYSRKFEALRLNYEGDFEWAAPLPGLHRRFFNLTKEEYDAALRYQWEPDAFAFVRRAHQ
jgi:RES domain-containing protein